MRLLLDANAFVWWVTSSSRLPAAARGAIADSGNEVLVGIGAVWELTIKRSLQKLHFPFDFEAEIQNEGFRVLAMIAQALAEGIPVTAADRRFASYGVQIVW